MKKRLIFWVKVGSLVSIAFDRDMDPARVEDAFTLLDTNLEPVSGILS